MVTRSKYKSRAEKLAEAEAVKAASSGITVIDVAGNEARDLAEYTAIVDGADAIAAHALSTLHTLRGNVPGALVAGFLRALVRFSLAEIPPTPPEVHTPASIAFMMVGAIERSAIDILAAQAEAKTTDVN